MYSNLSRQREACAESDSAQCTVLVTIGFKIKIIFADSALRLQEQQGWEFAHSLIAHLLISLISLKSNGRL